MTGRTRTAVARCLAAGLALAVAPAGARAQPPTLDVTLSVDRSRVEVGDVFAVEIRTVAKGTPVESIDPPAFDDFEVVGRAQRQPQQFTFSFGGRIQLFESTTVEVFQLRALRVGSFVIGPARVRAAGRTVESDRVTLIVVPSAAGLTRVDPVAGADDAPALDPSALDDVPTFDPQAFLHTTVAPERPVVGEQVTVQTTLYVADRLRGSPEVVREPTADGFWVHDLQARAQLGAGVEAVVKGRRFHAYALRRFAAFPLQAGTAEIGAATVRVPSVRSIFGGLTSDGLTRQSAPVPVEVQPLPEADRPPDVRVEDVAVGAFDLRVRLEPRTVTTGEAVTLTAVVKGFGNLKTVRLALPELDGLVVLPPEVQDELDVVDDRVGGSRTHRWLLVPERPGAITVPPLSLPTYDPTADRWRVLEGPALSFAATGPARVEPPPVAEGPEAPADDLVFGPLRTESRLERARAPLSAAPWFGWAAALPPAAFGGFLLGGWLRRRRAKRTGDDGRRVIQEARRRVDRAAAAARGGDDERTFHGEAARAVEVALGRLLGEPIGGYTRAELGPRLRERGLPETLARRVVDELERADAARFGLPGAGGTVDDAHARVKRLLDELGRQAGGRGR